MAGKVLSLAMTKKAPKYLPVSIKITRKLEKMKAHLEKATELRIHSSARKLCRRLRDEAREMRKMRMSPTTYIKHCRDRVSILERDLEQQKEKESRMYIRGRFRDSPSMRTITEGPEAKLPDLKRTEEHFKKMYSRQDNNPNQPTPTINNWLNKLKSHKDNVIQNEVNEDSIKIKLEKTLKKAAPWKAAGEDGIVNAIYKMLPAAKNYLLNSIIKLLKGKTRVHERDVRGKVVLIYKDGDQDDPANYRPIALLNTDYKILTSIITNIIEDELPE